MRRLGDARSWQSSKPASSSRDKIFVDRNLADDVERAAFKRRSQTIETIRHFRQEAFGLDFTQLVSI